MIVDVASILKELGGRLPVDGFVDMGKTDFLGEEFVFEQPLAVKGSISCNGESLILRADVEGSAQVCCARCRKPLLVPISFSLDETFIQGEAEVENEDEDVIVFSGHEIDLDDVVFNGFLMNVSGKYLCDENCKGLCVHCGADLNKGECSCDQDAIDPRWAALKDIMDKNME